MPTPYIICHAIAYNEDKISRNIYPTGSVAAIQPLRIMSACSNTLAHIWLRVRCWFILLLDCGAFWYNIYIYPTYVVIVCNPYHSKIYCAHTLLFGCWRRYWCWICCRCCCCCWLLSLHRKGQRHPSSSSPASSSTSSFSWKPNQIPKHQISKSPSTSKAFGRSQ